MLLNSKYLGCGIKTKIKVNKKGADLAPFFVCAVRVTLNCMMGQRNYEVY